MHDCTPRVVSVYITDVMDKNTRIPLFHFSLHPKDVASGLPTDSNSTVTLHVWGRPVR